MKRALAALIMVLTLAGPLAARDDDRESFLRDIVVAPGESADDAICVFCSVVVRGTVRSDVVVIGGGVEIEGAVEDDVVIIGGGLHLGPGALAGGNVVAYGGPVERAEGANIGGKVLVKPYFHLPGQRQLFLQGLLALSGLNLALVLLLALLLRRRVSALADTLVQRPGSALLTGLVVLTVAGVLFYFSDEDSNWAMLAGWTGSALLVLIFLPGYTGLAAALGRLIVGRRSRRVGLLSGALATTLLLIIPVLGFVNLLVLLTLAVGVATLSGLAALTGWVRRRRAAQA